MGIQTAHATFMPKPRKPGPDRKPFTCRFDEELIERCEAMASKQRTSTRAVIEQCILFGLAHLDEIYKDIPAPQKKKSGN